MRLRKVDIRDFWPQIKPQLIEILQGYDEPVEEVYAACRYDRAHLFIADGVGFTILREFNEEVTNKKVLFMWFTYKLNDGTAGMDYMKDVEEIARSIGAKKISFNTTRKGFEKYLGPEWKMDHIVFEKDVNYV